MDSNDIENDNDQLPRPGSVMYNFNYQNESAKKGMLKKWSKMNKYLIIPLYRVKFLPLLGFGKIFLILSTKGWKTGKKRRTPLEYRKYEGVVTIFAARGEDATWVKNLRANSDEVSVTKGFHSYKPRVTFISNEEQKISILKWYISKYGKSAKVLFGWDPKKDDLNSVDLSKLSEMSTIIQLHKD